MDKIDNTNNELNTEIIPEIKRVTLHPLTAEGETDLEVNLYPKTLLDGIVDREGKPVEVQEKLISGETIKTINGESVLGGGDIKTVDAYTKEESNEKFLSKEAATETYETIIDANEKFATKEYVDNKENLIETTWAELKALRDSSKLIPGRFYRITDYTCTTTQENTQSAGHVFDIIVLALDTDKLSEEASAIQHEGDTYFANNKLEAWEIKYCLDNDNTRFAWADTENGKGVIYWLKDEYNNEVPYDFKNIIFDFVKSFGYFQWGSNWTFIRDNSLDAEGYYGWRTSDGSTPSAWSNPYCFTNTENVTTSSTLYSDTKGSTLSYGGQITSVSMKEFSSYTFSYTTSSVNYDASLVGHSQMCFNNSIREYRISGVLQLNRLVFYKSSSRGELKTYNNTFSNDCYNNIFSELCYNNTFGNDCHDNTFGNGCIRNVFGNNCYGNTFGNNCSNNVFGNNCYGNTFGNNCSNNVFSELCYDNTFGSDCYNNIFGNDCHDNTFADNCYNNTFGNGCSNNIFNHYCNSNTFGNDCHDNTFDYARWNILENGVSYVSLTSGQTGSGSAYLQNIRICLGVKGISGSHKTITCDRGLEYETTISMANSQTILV